ncbi:LapA family protein [Methylobrevis albus]|nr:LapA family protein [Methylobrevis albus]
MRLLIWLLVGGPIAVVVMALAMVNNQPVTILLDPVTPESPLFSATAPLYAVFFATLMVGVLIGGIAVWAGQGRFRRAARRNQREAVRWQVEAERLKEEIRPTADPALPAPTRRAA